MTYFWADSKKKEKPQNLPAPEVCHNETGERGRRDEWEKEGRE